MDIIIGTIKQLAHSKFETGLSFATSNFCTFLNVFFQIDVAWLKYVPTFIGVLVPVVMAAYISYKKDKQEREHKEELHTLDLIKELQKSGVIKPGTNREEIRIILKEFGAKIKTPKDAT